MDPGTLDPGPVDPGRTDPGGEDPGPRDVPPDAIEATLFHRLGRTEGITAFVENFLARATVDARVNAYFLNSSVDTGKIATCLVALISAAAGDPEVSYPGAGEPAGAGGCRSMGEAHGGLGISAADFAAMTGHMRVALNAGGVATEDAADVMAMIEPLEATIVEDPDNDATVYQRLGRKPGIVAVVEDLVERMVADAHVAGFFAGRDLERFETCLVRWICAIDGPCRYGEGVEDALRIDGETVPCRPLADAHAGVAGGGGSPIGWDHVETMVRHLAGALDAAGAGAGDRDAVVAAFGGRCAQVVPGGFGCVEGLFDRVGGAEGLREIADALVERLRTDPAVNAYFSNASVDPDHIATCLTTQLAALAGSPEHSYPSAGDTPDSMGCRSLVQAHAGLGISGPDMDDFLAHLTAALAAADVHSADIERLISALGAHREDVVADEEGDGSLYQRFGGRIGIDALVTEVLDRVLADDALKAFFETTGRDRLETCFARRICAIDGPCHYGAGAEEALRVGEEIVPCGPLERVHGGVTHPTTGAGISIRDLRALLDHFAAVLDERGAEPADREALLGALEGLCPLIVAGERGCPGGLLERMGGEATVETVVDLLVDKLGNDVRVNAYFRNDSVDLARLEGCFETYLSWRLGDGGTVHYPGPGDPADA